MCFTEFIIQVIDEGIIGTTADYGNSNQNMELEGSIAGF